MIALIRALILFSLTINLSPLYASDEFSQPLKSHQLLTLFSGYHLRDPQGGFETFEKACSRLQNVMEQKVPKAVQSEDRFLAENPKMLALLVSELLKDRLPEDQRTNLVLTLKYDNGSTWARTCQYRYGWPMSPETYGYPWHAIALIRNLQILPIEQCDVDNLWQSAMKSYGSSLAIEYNNYEAGKQLVYAERMYTLAQQEVFSRVLTSHALQHHAFEEDGQNESLSRTTSLSKISGFAHIIPELSFAMPCTKSIPLSDQLTAYTQAYKVLASIQNFECDLLAKTLDQCCPYKMSPGEKTFIQKHFAGLSKKELQEELEVLPAILWFLTDHKSKNIRFVDLLCCRPDHILTDIRSQSFKRLMELYVNVKDKHILAKVRELARAWSIPRN